MPRAGGEADKVGNQYESVWTVDAVIDVFQARFRLITIEGFGDESIGVEFHLEKNDGNLQFHSVKRQKQGGDWSVADLCRKDSKTQRSILGDLFAKRLSNSQAELRFVSATGANELRELTERAKKSHSALEYRRALTEKRLLTAFESRIVPLSDGDEDHALADLKSLEVVLQSHNELTRTVERRLEELFYRTDGSALRPDDVRRMIADYVLANLGTAISTERVRDYLRSSGLGIRDWKADPTVLDAVARINKRYSAIVETELINATHLVRQESSRIVEVIEKTESLGALIVGPGGFGKSCVIAQCLSQIAARNIPTLCLRMDSFEP